MKAIAYFAVPAGLVVLLGLAPANGPDVLTAEETCSIWGTGDCVTTKNGDWGCDDESDNCEEIRDDEKDKDDGDDKLKDYECTYTPEGETEAVGCGTNWVAEMCDD